MAPNNGKPRFTFPQAESGNAQPAGKSARSLQDVYRERFLKSARQHRNVLRSGDDLITERTTIESMQAGKSVEVEVENRPPAACGHMLQKDSYRLPDGRWTCNVDACRRPCQFLCQRILPTRELWRIGARHVCTACLVWSLGWEAIKGIGHIVRALLVAVARYS